MPRNVLGTWEEPGIKMIVIHEVLTLKELIVLRGKDIYIRVGTKVDLLLGVPKHNLFLFIVVFIFYRYNCKPTFCPTLKVTANIENVL